MFYDHRFWSIFGLILVDSPYEYGQTCHFLRSISPISRSADFCHIRYVIQLARLTVSTPLSNLCGARARPGLSFAASKIAGSSFPIRIWLFPYDFSAPKISNALFLANFRPETCISNLSAREGGSFKPLGGIIYFCVLLFCPVFRGSLRARPVNIHTTVEYSTYSNV